MQRATTIGICAACAALLFLFSNDAPAQTDESALLNARALKLYYNASFDEAMPLARRALELRERTLPEGHVAIAESLTTLALLYQHVGQIIPAMQMHRRALVMREKALPADHPDIATSLTYVGHLGLKLRRLNQAENCYSRALAIREKALPPDHPHIADSLSSLAHVYRRQRRSAEAEPMFKRALAIREKVLPPGHLAIAQSLTDAAVISLDNRRLAEAEGLYERALAIREKALPPSHPAILTNLYALSRVCLQQRNWAKALAHARRATSILSQVGERATLSTDRSAAADYEAKLHSFLYGLHVLAAHRAGGADPALRAEAYEVAQLAERSTAASALAQMAARQALGSSELSGLARERQDVEEQWRSEEWRLGSALGQGEPSAMDAARRTLADIEERLKALDNRLDGEFKQYAALAHPKPLSLAASQALLGPKEALLVFADAGPFPGFAPEGYAWALTSTDARWVKLPFNYLDVMRHAQALRCGLDRDGDWYWSSEKSRWLAREKWCAEVRPDGLARDEMPPFDLTRAHALYKGLLGQFEDLIKEKHLLVVPPRLMGTLPLGVLVMEPPNPALQGDDAFRSAAWLGHRQPITVLPSVSSLKILRDVARASQATRPLIGFGNPMLEGDRTNPEHAQRAKLAREKQFCAQLPAGDPQRVAKLATGERADARAIFVDGKVDVAAIRAAPPLPETADELCAVARALTAGDGDIYLGAKATKTAVMQASAYGTLARYRIVHFATHGLLAGETEWFAKGHAEPALLMTPPADGVDAEQLERDNGLLTASDVSQLQLDAEWVILSACNTASGAHTGGEALSGLARAFFYAGARALLVSHWYVDSDATVKLITRAFAELKSDPAIARSEALRRSMISLMTDTSAHPAVWAPFVVVGEGAR